MNKQREEQEEVLRAIEELARRRQTDPLYTFQPHKKQQAFIDSVLKREKLENWFVAANRSGKSDAGAYIGASLARFGVPGTPGPTSGWVSALDFSTSRDVIQPKYFDNGFVPPGQVHPPFIPKHEIDSWRVDDQILRLKNGSIVGFKSADSGRRKYQGSERDWFHMDEEHPWEIYEEAVIRVGARPLLFFCTATILPPEGMHSGASWVFGKIIQPVQEKRLPHVGLFGASIYDNPGIPKGDIERLEAIYPEGSLSRRIRLGGEWLPGLGGSRAYTAFQRALHVEPAPPVSVRRPLIWTWDFNVEPMCSLVGQFFDRTYWVMREFVLNESNIPDMCDAFKNHFPDHGAEIWLYGDATSNRRTSQTGKTDYFVILQEMKAHGIPIRMRVPLENPRVPDRLNSINRLLLDEHGQIRLKIDPSCQELIKDLDGVLRDNRGGIVKSNNRRDPYFHRTHTSDALGYWLAAEEPVRPPIDRSFAAKGTIRKPAYGFSRNR